MLCPGPPRSAPPGRVPPAAPRRLAMAAQCIKRRAGAGTSPHPDSEPENRMLYKFKSQVAADVIMLKPSAEELLKIIGKTPGPTGIVTAAQAPAAVAAIKAEIERRETAGHAEAAPTNPDEARAQREADEVARQELITLRQRAAPFIELLERSAAEGKDVVWGV